MVILLFLAHGTEEKRLEVLFNMFHNNKSQESMTYIEYERLMNAVITAQSFHPSLHPCRCDTANAPMDDERSLKTRYNKHGDMEREDEIDALSGFFRTGLGAVCDMFSLVYYEFMFAILSF